MKSNLANLFRIEYKLRTNQTEEEKNYFCIARNFNDAINVLDSKIKSLYNVEGNGKYLFTKFSDSDVHLIDYYIKRIDLIDDDFYISESAFRELDINNIFSIMSYKIYKNDILKEFFEHETGFSWYFNKNIYYISSQIKKSLINFIKKEKIEDKIKEVHDLEIGKIHTFTTIDSSTFSSVIYLRIQKGYLVGGKRDNIYFKNKEDIDYLNNLLKDNIKNEFNESILNYKTFFEKYITYFEEIKDDDLNKKLDTAVDWETLYIKYIESVSSFK